MNKIYLYLLEAIKAKDKMAIEELLKTNQYDLNGEPPNFKATPLCYAIRCGNLEIVQFLVENGADVNYTIPNAYTPLMEAARLSDAKLRILNFLLDKGAIINQSAQSDFKTALYVAVQKQNIFAIQRLLEKGADTEIGAPDANFGIAGKNLYTPLFLAVLDGYRVIIETLLKAGADANIGIAQERWSQNLLCFAIGRNCKWLAELLLKYGASDGSNYLTSKQFSLLQTLLKKNIHSQLADLEQNAEKIENLDLRGLPIKSIPSQIPELRNLKRLFLGQNTFNKINCKDLKNNTLQYLHLQNALLSNFEIEGIENYCPNLKVIDLRGNKLKKSLVKELRTKLPQCIIAENDAEWETVGNSAKFYFL